MANKKRIERAIARAAAKDPRPLTKAEIASKYEADRNAGEAPPLTASPLERKIVRREIDPDRK